MAVYVTLSDDTYARLEQLDIRNIEIIKALTLENGLNIHFLLLASDSYKTIMIGLRRVIKKHNPRTISWWEPDFSYLHKYNMN